MARRARRVTGPPHASAVGATGELLHPLTADDAVALARWLPRVATETGCRAWSDEAALRRAVGREDVLTIEDDGPVGLLSYELHAPRRDAAHVRFLAVRPQRRRLGIGGRAALALEGRLRGNVARVYVAVPARVGLAFYFWLRLGYRPLIQREWPATPEDAPSVWLVRDL